MNADKLPVWQMSVDEVKALIETNRQQADRIAELEKQLNLHKNAHHKCIEILQEKQSEVMAYIYQDPDTLQPALKFANPTNYWATVISTPDIPLYTTPHHASDVKQTKPLSDEEIGKIAMQDPFWWNPDSFKCDIDWLGFARAIEAKVRGEK